MIADTPCTIFLIQSLLTSFQNASTKNQRSIIHDQKAFPIFCTRVTSNVFYHSGLFMRALARECSGKKRLFLYSLGSWLCSICLQAKQPCASPFEERERGKSISLSDDWPRKLFSCFSLISDVAENARGNLSQTTLLTASVDLFRSFGGKQESLSGWLAADVINWRSSIPE
jgi:hypothetical protein